MSQFLTCKEIFEKVKNHLLTQKVRACEVKTETELCRYLDAEGRKCAVGCLIKSDLYHKGIEGDSVDKLCNDDGSNLLGKALIDSGINYRDSNVFSLLQELQELHDQGEPYDWESELDNLEINFEEEFEVQLK